MKRIKEFGAWTDDVRRLCQRENISYEKLLSMKKRWGIDCVDVVDADGTVVLQIGKGEAGEPLIELTDSAAHNAMNARFSNDMSMAQAQIALYTAIKGKTAVEIQEVKEEFQKIAPDIVKKELAEGAGFMTSNVV